MRDSCDRWPLQNQSISAMLSRFVQLLFPVSSLVGLFLNAPDDVLEQRDALLRDDYVSLILSIDPERQSHRFSFPAFFGQTSSFIVLALIWR